MGYFATSKAYRLYDEENKKFILSRDVIFLESDKINSIVDKQLAHLEKFASKKFYFAFNNVVPHTEGGVPILNQSMVLPSLTHENVIAEENLDDSNVSTGPEISLEEPVLELVFQDEQPSQPLQQPLRRSTRA